MPFLGLFKDTIKLIILQLWGNCSNFFLFIVAKFALAFCTITYMYAFQGHVSMFLQESLFHNLFSDINFIVSPEHNSNYTFTKKQKQIAERILYLTHKQNS